jgi:hypothetical protein
MNPAGGDFQTGGNWNGGVAPGTSSGALFGLGGGAAYSVTFSADATNSALSVSAGDAVTLALGNQRYTVSGTTTIGSGALLAVSGPGGTFLTGKLAVAPGGTFTFNGGTFGLTADDITIGAGQFVGPVVTLASGQGLLTPKRLIVQGGGVLNVAGGTVIRQFGGNGFNGPAGLVISPGGSVSLSAGSLNAGAITNNGSFSFTGGQLNLNSDVGVGPGQLFPDGTGFANQTLYTYKNFIVQPAASTALGTGSNLYADQVAVGAGGTLNLNGGSLYVNGATANLSGAGTLNFTAGYLSIAGGSTPTVPVGPTATLKSLTLGPSQQLLVYAMATAVGPASAPTFNLAGGTMAGTLFVGGPVAGGSGIATVSSGSWELAGLRQINIAGDGSGLIQTGGTIHDAMWVIVGANFGYGTGSASYELQGGSLSIGTSITIGAGTGRGSLTQSGGSLFSNSSVSPATAYLGGDAGSRGDYFLTGGSASLGDVNVGYHGDGAFSQSSGTAGVRQLLVGYTGGKGTANLSGGVLNSANVDVGNLFFSGGPSGVFNQSGGVHNIAGTLTIVPASGVTREYNLSGGTLNASAVVGPLNQTGGVANIAGSLSGTSLVNVGGGSTGALLNVRSFSLSALQVGDQGLLAVAPAAQGSPRVTNVATSLSISGSGRLDVGNQDALTSSPAATIRADLASAYHGGDWAGPAGITSSLAIANPAVYTLGYAASADPSAQDAGLHVLPGQTLVRPTLTGDANLDGKVNFFDLSQLLGYKYNTGQPASYTDGDLNYDGVVDFFDIVTLLSANYNSGVSFAPADRASAGASVPEPSSALLIIGGGFATALRRRRRRR